MPARRDANVRTAQTNRRTRVWHHQIRDGIPAILTAWPRQGQGRMDPDLPGVESETHGLIASSNGKLSKKQWKNRQK